jgi:hypothetical protein
MNGKEARAKAAYLNNIATVMEILDENKVPYTFRECYEGYQLRFDWADDADIICHKAVTGGDRNRVESMGFSWDGDDVSNFENEAMAQLIVAEYIIYKLS